MSTTVLYGDRVNGASNQVGNSTKTSYNKLTGYTKIDNRPDAGPMNNYALQVRNDVLNTSGQQLGCRLRSAFRRNRNSFSKSGTRRCS